MINVNVNVFADKQMGARTNLPTDRPKKYKPPSYRCGGKKILDWPKSKAWFITKLKRCGTDDGILLFNFRKRYGNRRKCRLSASPFDRSPNRLIRFEVFCNL